MVQTRGKIKESLKLSSFRSNEEQGTARSKKVMMTPAANVEKTDQEYILTIASPGFKREHFSLLIEKNIITIAATKETELEPCIHDLFEYDFHRWKRDFLLPEDVNALHTTAQYLDGELVIRIPRGTTEKLSGSIPIYVY